MKRSIGVTVIAVLSLLGSILTLLMGFLMAWVVFRVPPPSQSQFPASPTFFKLVMFSTVLMYVLPAIWGIWTSFGLFRLKEWARLSIIVFAVLLILMSVLGVLTLLVVPIPTPPTGPRDKSIQTGVRLVMGVFSSALVGLGVWWLMFFNRRKVKEQFISSRPQPSMSTSPQTSETLQIPPIVPGAPQLRQRPLSITILAWFLLLGCLFMPLNVVLRAPAVLLTEVLTGYPSMLYYLAFFLAHLSIGIGLLRLRPAARVACVWYFAFGFINTAVFYLAPGGHARALALIEKQQSMFPWMQSWQNQMWRQIDPTPFLILGACLGLAGLLVAMYFLITRKQAFERIATTFAGLPGGTI